MPQPSLSATYIIALVTTVVSLFLTQGLIDNGVAKLVTGLAAAFVPAIIAVTNTLFHGRVQAAKITAQAPVKS